MIPPESVCRRHIASVYTVVLLSIHRMCHRSLQMCDEYRASIGTIYHAAFGAGLQRLMAFREVSTRHGHQLPKTRCHWESRTSRNGGSTCNMKNEAASCRFIAALYSSQIHVRTTPHPTTAMADTTTSSASTSACAHKSRQPGATDWLHGILPSWPP